MKKGISIITWSLGLTAVQKGNCPLEHYGSSGLYNGTKAEHLILYWKKLVYMHQSTQ